MICLPRHDNEKGGLFPRQAAFFPLRVIEKRGE